MIQSPFSPFVRRVNRKDFKRRQSQLPSDLIDWDAPEIPELEKQKIIYEDLLRETNEEHIIETLLYEEIMMIACETQLDVIDKQNEERLMRERSQVNLLLNQLKMFESHSQELENHIKDLETNYKQLEQNKGQLQQDNEKLQQTIVDLELKSAQLSESKEAQVKELEDQIKLLESNIEKLAEEIENLKNHNSELEDLNKDQEFQIKELEAELSSQLELFTTKKSELQDMTRKLQKLRAQLNHYKKLAKGSVE